ncbi:MAG: signal recognition particle-docking protein FtsY [Nanoarchaeota archaeon]|nr:signal recognition particle-docking protein FtsY [Nanoarchaeota archaeon]
MFKFLKEKLKQWTEKVAKSPKEEKSETKPEEKISKKPKKGIALKQLGTDLDAALRGEIFGHEPKLEDRENEKELPKSFFQRIKEKTGKIKISEDEFDRYRDELELLLLENNVAFEVSDRIIKELKSRIVGRELLKNGIEGEIKNALGDIISEILVKPFDLLERVIESEKKPFVILFFGINGSGKTTSIAKIAEFLKSRKIKCVLAAADTFRAASIEQLKEHGENIGIPVIAHEYGSDPASVGFDAINYAKKNRADCVLIDTAGRMHTEKNLIKEMEKISKVCSPDLKIFVGESITGNDATEQARIFNESIGIDGLILAKSDIDEKGGTALSVGFVTKKPILFLGTGQKYSDIEPFDKNKFLDKLGL